MSPGPGMTNAIVVIAAQCTARPYCYTHRVLRRFAAMRWCLLESERREWLVSNRVHG
jgi:hypothetical protein